MDFQKKDKNFFKYLAKEIKNRDNPTDLKEVVIGFVENLEPVTVTTDGGAFTFAENNNLFISEQFRLRCEIDKTFDLSVNVPNLLTQAMSAQEIHSFTQLPCNMPQAIEFLAQAITKVSTEVLNLKCDLQVGDKVILAPLLDMHGAYVLIDKVV